MSRTRRARNLTFPGVEALEGRKLMANDAYLHLGPMTAAAEKAFGSADQGWIEVKAFDWGASNPVTIGSGATGTGGGKVSISSFNIETNASQKSGDLFAECCTGQHFREAELFMVKGNGKGQEPTKLEYDFTNVMVESIQWSGSVGDAPVESVSFAFGDFDINYSPTTSTPGSGSTNKPSAASWDLGRAISSGEARVQGS